MSFYEKNIETIIQKDMQLGAYLYSVSTNEQFEVFLDEKDDLNINIYDKKNDFIFYKTKPIDEITKQYEELMSRKSRYPFIPIYGIGNGLLIKMLLNLDKYIMVIEPNLELIYIAINFFDFSKEIKNGKLKIFYQPLTNRYNLLEYLKNPDIKTFVKTYDLEINNNYYPQFYQEDIININHTIVDVISHLINAEGNSASDSLIGLDHHLQHIPNIIESYTLQSILKSSKQNDTAIIVSTGPSLAKQLPLLKKYADKLTILCIDASLPILQKEKIKPDLVFSMERVEATAKFFENLDKEFLKDTIFMPTSVSHPKTLQNLQGMQQCVSMRPFQYNRAFRLDKWGYIGIGMSAANMAFDFAFYAGFKNVIFIGQDLAFGKDRKTHSKGAIYGEEEKQYKKRKIFKIKGWYGDEVETTDIWKMFLTFFEENMKEFEKHERNVYNCTEGGAYINGAIHKPFKEVLESLELKPKKPIIGQKVSKEKQIHYLKRSKKLINLYIERLSCIKEKIEKTFLDVMAEIEKLEKLNKDEELEKIDFNQLAKTIAKIDIIKDILETDRVLIKFKNITNPIIVSAELNLALILVKESNTEIEKKAKMIEWIYAHKSWLFFLAGAIENILYMLKNSPKF